MKALQQNPAVIGGNYNISALNELLIFCEVTTESSLGLLDRLEWQ